MHEATPELTTLVKRKVNHLLLLVGANPLPNAVAGRLLLERKKGPFQVTFIHSTGTGDIAARLVEFLQVEGHSSRKPVDEGKPSSIYQAVSEALGKFAKDFPTTPKVGLHYTGGTKAMSVHAYRAVEQWAGKQKDVSFSYLDARRSKLVFDATNDEPEAEIWTDPSWEECQIELETLMWLHNWKMKTYADGKTLQRPKRSVVMPQTAFALAQGLCSAHTDREDLTDWDHWLRKTFRPATRDGQKWRSPTDLGHLRIDWFSAWPQVNAALQKEIKQVGASHLAIEEPALENWWPSGQKRRATPAEQEFCDWINGKWLEHAVLKALQDCPKTLNLQYTGMALKGLVDVRQEDVKKKQIDFDLDVIAMCGYHLFAFSCGMASGKGADEQLKLKLFEADMRARQLGGDQACVALVCRSEHPDRFEKEIRKTMDAGERIRIFGRKHLADLKTHFTTWITEQSRDS